MRPPCWWHIIAGALTVWSALVNGALPVACALGFLAYEVQQDKNIDSQSYLDIYEWAVAVYVNVAIMIPLRLWGVL